MHPTDVDFFVLIIVCVTIKGILHLQSTIHVVLIKWEKVYLGLFEFQFVTVQNGKKSKGVNNGAHAKDPEVYKKRVELQTEFDHVSTHPIERQLQRSKGLFYVHGKKSGKAVG